MTVTHDSPFALRYLAWMRERFPLTPTLLFVVLYGTVLLYGRWLTHDGPLAIGWRELLGFSACYGFFLMLRVFDEHKDFAKDLHNFPERVLQRGLITLGHLKVAGALCLAAQIGVSLWFDGGAFGHVWWHWVAVLVWSLLMLREFFISEWLSKRLVLYALSHMLIMPLAELWMAQMGALGRELPWTVLWISALSFSSGMSFEIARKLKAPEDERETVDSYTKSLGLRGAPLAVFVCLGTSLALQLVLVAHINSDALPLWAPLVLGPYLLATAWALWRFAAAPSAKRSKLCEGLTSIAMLVGYTVVLIALVSDRGVAWSGSQ
ncbi:MAG: prenyltransferase [Planctomycetota bacterium]